MPLDEQDRNRSRVSIGLAGQDPAQQSKDSRENSPVPIVKQNRQHVRRDLLNTISHNQEEFSFIKDERIVPNANIAHSVRYSQNSVQNIMNTTQPGLMNLLRNSINDTKTE